MDLQSREVTVGYERAPARAMLRAVGMTDADWDSPQVGVATSWNEVTPCNMSLSRLAQRAKEGVRAAGGFPMEFVTIAVSDGISMGHQGMHASLVSREVIADSVEVMVHAERLDALVTFAGCDKSLPGMIMAAARLNVPSVFLYGGTILPGRGAKGEALDIVSVFEAVGAHAAGGLTADELALIERNACPTIGSSAGMFTANTMAAAAEALGMCLPGSASAPAVDRRRDDYAYASGQAVIALVEAGIRPRQILTKGAFENAIAVVNALGGSTNAVLHLLAIANEARVELELEDFNRIGRRVAHIADLRPGGTFHMTDLDAVGGVPMVLRHLLEEGLLDGDCLTVTGRTMAENLAALDPPAPDGRVIHRLDDPIHAEGGIAVLRGSLAPNGAVVKVAGIDAMRFEGTARVFDGETAAMDEILAGRIRPGDVVVIRYEGPRRRDAGDAGRHRGPQGGGPGRRHGPGHRRAVLGRYPGVLCRACGAGGGRRRAHLCGGRRRPHHHRRRRPHHRPPGRRRHPRRPQGGLEAAAAPLHDGGAGQVRSPGHRRRTGSRDRALNRARLSFLQPGEACFCRLQWERLRANRRAGRLRYEARPAVGEPGAYAHDRGLARAGFWIGAFQRGPGSTRRRPAGQCDGR